MRTLLFLLVLCLGPQLQADDRTSGTDEITPGSNRTPSGEAALFGDLPVVEAAALHSQTLAEAPASVTVITAADIRKYGYRTLGEALASARGFVMTSDHIYKYAGVRGFAIPGDYNTRFLVMINGHPMTEIVFDSNNFFGQDFGLDMDLVDRIEIIRGPSSALYGSNGILATINIVTQSPVDGPKVGASVEMGGGPQKATVQFSHHLGRGANLLLEGSAFLDSGHDLNIPEEDPLKAQKAIAHHLDGQSGYHSYMNLAWGSWNLSAYFNTRLSLAPALGDGGTFNSSGQFFRDTRNFMGVSYTHSFASSARLRWEIYYDQYRFSDRYDTSDDGGTIDNRDDDFGDWISSQLIYSRPTHIGELTLGLSTTAEFRNLQKNLDVSPNRLVRLNINRPDWKIAPFAQQEWDLARKWKLYLGLRLDQSQSFGALVSPRVALVYLPSMRTSYKLVYSRPFRNPSRFEEFYADGYTLIANPQLHPERAHALEVTAERHLGKSLDAVINGYRYWLQSVIQTREVANSLLQYQNAGNMNSIGVEFELRGHPAAWIETDASLSLQRATNAAVGAVLPNAPGRIGKFKAAMPLYRDRIYFSASMQYLSSRMAIDRTPMRPVALVDATVSTSRLFRGFDVVAGMRNVLNWHYDDPVDLIDRIPANGRALFVKLIWQQRE